MASIILPHTGAEAHLDDADFEAYGTMGWEEWYEKGRIGRKVMGADGRCRVEYLDRVIMAAEEGDVVVFGDQNTHNLTRENLSVRPRDRKGPHTTVSPEPPPIECRPKWAGVYKPYTGAAFWWAQHLTDGQWVQLGPFKLKRLAMEAYEAAGPATRAPDAAAEEEDRWIRPDLEDTSGRAEDFFDN